MDDTETEKRYFTGLPCKYGHISERLKSNRGCIECAKNKLKNWQKQNPDKVRNLDRKRHERDKDRRNALQRQYAREHKDQATQRKRLWASLNPEKRLAIQKRWNEKNRHKINAYAQNRRALLYCAGTHTGEDVEVIFKAQSGLCAICSMVLVKKHVDHIMPISRGGRNTKDNLQILCPSCNLIKSNKIPENYRQDSGK